MTSHSDASLVDQRETLRRQLLAQRHVIAQQLEPDATSEYPRSMTMRFLKQQSVPAGKVIAGVGALFIGVRYFKNITTALAVIKAVRSVATMRRSKLRD